MKSYYESHQSILYGLPLIQHDFAKTRLIDSNTDSPNYMQIWRACFSYSEEKFVSQFLYVLYGCFKDQDLLLLVDVEQSEKKNYQSHMIPVCPRIINFVRYLLYPFSGHACHQFKPKGLCARSCGIQV